MCLKFNMFKTLPQTSVLTNLSSALGDKKKKKKSHVLGLNMLDTVR